MEVLLNSAELKTPGPKKRNYPRRISAHYFYTEAEKKLRTKWQAARGEIKKMQKRRKPPRRRTRVRQRRFSAVEKAKTFSPFEGIRKDSDTIQQIRLN